MTLYAMIMRKHLHFTSPICLVFFLDFLENLFSVSHHESSTYHIFEIVGESHCNYIWVQFNEIDTFELNILCFLCKVSNEVIKLLENIEGRFVMVLLTSQNEKLSRPLNFVYK